MKTPASHPFLLYNPPNLPTNKVETVKQANNNNLNARKLQGIAEKTIKDSAGTFLSGVWWQETFANA